jgi:uncharacterized protein YjiS (DUF1127 family)
MTICALHHTGKQVIAMFLVNLIAAAKSALSDWRRRQQAYIELSSLDDRSLADIGIRRSEIPSIVEGYHDADRASETSDFPGFDPQHARLAGGHKWFPLFPSF